tara:strand:- start:46 stop:507 length:462 start_codon:yes stop_codon:yes gene_type:complete
MKNNIEKVYSKLPQKKKLGLKKHKVDLYLIDDIKDNLQSFEEAESEASYLAYELGDELINTIDRQQQEVGNEIDNFIVNGSVRMLGEIAENISAAMNKIQDISEEMGINPNEIYEGFSDLSARVEDSIMLEQDAKNKYKEIVNLAGFLNDFWK